MVEDSPAAAEQLTRYLADLGIASVVHPSGRGVIEKAIEVAPDVLLLDILLPDISGWQVLTQLTADPRTRNLPVIVASVVEEREKAEALGAVGYLVKPVSLSDLQSALRRGMERAAARQMLSTTVAAAGEAMPPGPVVLLADDSEIILSTLGDFLRAQSYQVVVARRGDEALEKARQVRPAMILMDIQMPVLDGLEAISRLRAEADPQLATTPVIALTALAMPGDQERCLAAGATAYVSKPVNLETLARVIKSHLEDR